MRSFLIWFLLVGLAFGAVPEHWFEDKALLGSATREAIYAALPKRHEPIATLPSAAQAAFKEPPKSLKIYAGEAYFVDHCLNHHPDVPNAIYRQMDSILSQPDEMIIDRRKGRDGLLFVKRMEDKTCVLVVARYPSGDLLYKTLYFATPPIFPKLPRFSPPRP